MTANPPKTLTATADLLKALGQHIRAHRKHLRISATAAAEAAHMSRVTLHRIEKGEPSVTMGAYLNAMTALGLKLAVQPDTPKPSASAATTFELPTLIKLAQYPQLQQLAWHVQGASELTPREAWHIYERNARHLDMAALQPHERELLEALRREANNL